MCLSKRTRTSLKAGVVSHPRSLTLGFDIMADTKWKYLVRVYNELAALRVAVRRFLMTPLYQRCGTIRHSIHTVGDLCPLLFLWQVPLSQRVWFLNHLPRDSCPTILISKGMILEIPF